MNFDPPSRPPGDPKDAAGPDARDPVTVVVAMQARLDRECIAAFLGSQPDFEVVGLAGTSREVMSLCTTLQPGVLVLSALVAWPPDVTGVSAVRMCSPDTEVLVVAPHAADRCAQLNPRCAVEDNGTLSLPNGTCLLSALAHGARGALLRDVAPAEFVEAVRTVARGERWIGAGMDTPAPEATVLTKRERQVSLMIGRGYSNKEVATALDITEPTVKKHISSVLRKLRLHDRLQLGLFVARHPLTFESD